MSAAERVVAPASRWRVLVNCAARVAEGATAVAIGLLIMHLVLMLKP